MSELEKVRPWMASLRRDSKSSEMFPEDRPKNCRVLVFDCVGYSTPQMHIIAFDEKTGLALAHKS